MQRAERAKATRDAEIRSEKERAAGLEAKLAEHEKALAVLPDLQRQLAEAAAARQRAEQRIPLIRHGVEDDEVGELVIDRWSRTQSSRPEAERLDLQAWLAKEAAADKIVGVHLRTAIAARAEASSQAPAGRAPAAQPQPPPPAVQAPQVTAGTAQTVTVPGTRIEFAHVQAENQEQIRRFGRVVDTTLHDKYMVQEGIKPFKR